MVRKQRIWAGNDCARAHDGHRARGDRMHGRDRVRRSGWTPSRHGARGARRHPAAAGAPHGLRPQRDGTAAYTPPKRNLADMSGADVTALQQRLSSLKYYLGKIDGKFGG